MLEILQQNKELNSHTLHQDPNFESKNLKKQQQTNKLKNVKIWRFFYILTYINFRQTNAINIIFYTSFMLGILQQTKEFSSHAIHQILKIIKNLNKN